MPNFAKPINRFLFVVCVIITGAIAGAFIWAFFFVMEKGIELIWNALPKFLGSNLEPYIPGISQGPFGFVLYPLIMCLVGAVVIGIFDKTTGVRPEELSSVMAKVKKDGCYSYDNIGKLSLAALFPLLFGGSVGPEAGLTGVIAGLCTWVGERMRRFGADFRELTTLGTQAALTAVFTAPFYGFVAPLVGTADTSQNDNEVNIKLPKPTKTLIYLCAIVGALGTFLFLGDLFGGGLGLPRFSDINVGKTELLFLVPLALAGCACGWIFHLSSWATTKLAYRLGERSILKASLAGLVLAICGMFLPYTMFAGESQSYLLMENYLTIPASILIATGFVKAALTPFCVHMGWRGGHFFPLIFAGISIGYGFALITGADAVSCVAACTAGCMAAVMRQPIMTALMLLMCFPLRGVAVMIAAALIASAIPLPSFLAQTKVQQKMKKKKGRKSND